MKGDIALIIDGYNMSFDAFDRKVFDAIKERHFARVLLKPVVSIFMPDDAPTLTHIPREIDKISVSPWLNNELRWRRTPSTAKIAVDYCDGQGARVRWFGIIVDFDETLNKLQARLGPDA
jgi:hypothetical protein